MESGDLKTAFLSGDPDPAYTGSDAWHIDPPSDLKSWLNLGPDDVLRLRKAVCGLINAPFRWHQRLSRALRQAGFVSLQMDPCVWILPVPRSMKNVSSVDVPTKLRTACCRFLCVTCYKNSTGSLIWLVVAISLFRKLCSGFGLSLSLEIGKSISISW